MKPIAAALLLLTFWVSAASAEPSRSPAIIIWLVPPSSPPTEDDGEATGDFLFHSDQIIKYLKAKHPEIETVVVNSRAVTLRHRKIEIPASAGGFGFYLDRPNAAPLIISKVMTAPDFRCVAAKYFGWGKAECRQ